MVGHDDEDRILEPRLVLRGLEECANRVIRIGHPALAIDELRVDLARRPSVWAVVRSRHHKVVEGLASRMSLVGFLNRPGEGILIAGAPGVGEGRLLTGGLLSGKIHHPVAVGPEEVVHVIEKAVAAVDESGVVTLRAENGTEGREIFAALAAQDRLSRNRRNRQRERLHPAHRARAAGVATGEPKRLAGDAVQVGRQVLRGIVWRTVAAHEFSAQALNRDLDHIETAGGRSGLDAAGDIVEVGAGRHSALREERRAQLRNRVGARRIEALPLELVGPEGRQEGVLAVLRELGVVTIIPARLRVAHVAQAGREAFADGSMGGGSGLEVATADEIGDEQDRE